MSTEEHDQQIQQPEDGDPGASGATLAAPVVQVPQGVGPGCYASVLFCMVCGSYDFKDEGFSPTGARAVLRCNACGQKIYAGGAVVGRMSAAAADLQVAEFDAGSRKPPTGLTAAVAAGAKRYDPNIVSNGFVKLSFAVSLDQREVVMAAINTVRRMMGVQGRKWHGVALEMICADFLAGAPVKAVPQTVARKLLAKLTGIVTSGKLAMQAVFAKMDFTGLTVAAAADEPDFLTAEEAEKAGENNDDEQSVGVEADEQPAAPDVRQDVGVGAGGGDPAAGAVGGAAGAGGGVGV